MRVVFMGTPDFAAKSLERLISDEQEIVGVFTQPDRPKGRGMSIAYSPVKEVALANGIQVYQPENINDPFVVSELRLMNPDLFVVVAFGSKLSNELLEIPKLGAVNLHGSLLPKYRGSAPIQWAVLNGDTITGVSTMYLAERMDAGDVIFTAETEIGEYETSGELFDRLMMLGSDLLSVTLRAISEGSAPRYPQSERDASYTVMLDKSMSPINWNQPARKVIKWIYGLQPWPVATAVVDGQTLRVFKAEYSLEKTNKLPGTLVRADKNGLLFACKAGETVLIKEVQAAGKKRMLAADYLRGHPIQVP